MTYRRMISALTLMAFVGCLFALPMTAQAQSWNDNSRGGDSGLRIWNNQWGTNNRFSDGRGIGATLLRWIPGVLGGVAGYFLGASLGPIGRIAAAAVGFVVAKWIADKLFPSRDSYSYNDWNRNFNAGWQNQYQNNVGWGYGPRGSETGGATGGDSNLQAVRDRWITATREYQDSLRGSDTNASNAARANFESARQAYFDSIRSSYNR